jgi:WD40 repeat protein
MARQSLPDAEVPDPGRIASQQDFGRELTLARQQAGLTIRDVAKASSIPVSTVGDYFAGRHLPPARQPELLPSILAACQITEAEQVARWLDALNRVRRAPGRPPAGPAPYRGLASFQPEDAAWFFGREELALHLARLATGPGSPGLPLVVVGPSGSGKSSLLRAGLIPRLRSGTTARPDGRQVVLITPGATPVQTLAERLAPLARPGTEGSLRTGLLAKGLREDPERHARLASRGDEPPAIIVDQLEEIFTAGADEGRRSEFVAALAALSQHTLVVLGLRADFYGHVLGYPALARALQERQIVVGPMSAGQLRRAIVEPARRAGREVDDGLVEVLLADMRPHGTPGAGGHEAGALPLLSHALLATWSRGRGSRLTLADYQASGGIRDAIARTAEQAYAALDAVGQELTRQLFLRLVHIGEDGREARARLPLRDLPGDASAAAAVLERFVGQRLVTKDRAAAEITHEALLGAWPRLRAWIDADREDIRIRHVIEVAAQAWAEAGRETAALLRGGQLALAADWMAGEAHRAALSQDARDFVDAGITEERAQQAAARRHTRRLRQLVAALTVLVLLTVGLAGYAFHQRQLLLTAQDPAESRTVAIESDQVRANDPGLAAQLALAAYRISPTQQALTSLLESTAVPMAARIRDSAMVVQAVALAPGRHLLAVAAADGTLRLWNMAVTGHPAPFSTATDLGRNHPLYTAAFSPDGQVLAAAGADGKVLLWRVTDPRHPVPLSPLTGPTSTVYSLAFSPDGRWLAAGSADDTIRLWNVSDPARAVAAGGPLTGPASYIEAVAFSPDGQGLIPLGAPRTASASGLVEFVAFSPGGTMLASGSDDGTVRLWNLTDPAHPRQLSVIPDAHTLVFSVAFSPNGHVLAAASADEQVRLWKVTSPAAPVQLGKTLPGPTNTAYSVAFSPDGKVLAVGSADKDVRLWDVGDPARPHRIGPLLTGPTGYVYSVAFSPRGHILAAGNTDGSVWLWNLAHPARPTLIATLTGPSGHVYSVAFSPGGRTLAAADSSGLVWLWDTGAAAAARTVCAMAGQPLTHPEWGAYVQGVTYAPPCR